MLIFGPSDPDAEEQFPRWADPVDLTAPGPEDPAAR